MKLKGECYPCALRQVLAAARLVSDDERFHIEALSRASRELSLISPDVTPPEVGEVIYRIVREMSGNPDPFRSEKDAQNEKALEILPWIEKTVTESKEPLLMAVRLSIAGNSIDLGAQESFEIEENLEKAVSEDRELGDFCRFSDAVSRAREILLIADNSGEIVFDRVLLETIRSQKGGNVSLYLAVRGGPIINDVTEREARQCGMDRVAEIISTGMEMPGTVLSRCAPSFVELFWRADLVVSKGQGNWETLEGCGREVFFLFQAKCPVVARLNNCAEGDFLLIEDGLKV